MMIIIMIFMLRETLTILLKLQTKYVLCFSVSLQLNLSHSSATQHRLFFFRCCYCFAFYAACASIVQCAAHFVDVILCSCLGCVADIVFSQILLSSFLELYILLDALILPPTPSASVLPALHSVPFRSVSCVPMYLLIPFTSVSHNLHEPKILWPSQCEYSQPVNVLTFMKFMLFYFMY